jgi:hypothetical protein
MGNLGRGPRPRVGDDLPRDVGQPRVVLARRSVSVFVVHWSPSSFGPSPWPCPGWRAGRRSHLLGRRRLGLCPVMEPAVQSEARTRIKRRQGSLNRNRLPSSFPAPDGRDCLTRQAWSSHRALTNHPPTFGFKPSMAPACPTLPLPWRQSRIRRSGQGEWCLRSGRFVVSRVCERSSCGHQPRCWR